MASATTPKASSSPQSTAAPVVLADNFPSKTHLLVTNITELDPTVLSFSPDGDAFFVYNQSIFAQKYLPQYFKHSNYGSFVRQLNLYGFASSRHKENANVVVWSHPFFKRDRKDLLKNIKRTVKKSTKKPSHVYVTPRSTSTSASVSSEEVTSSPSNEDAAVSGEAFSRQVSSKGDEWLESELAYLKQQNRNLEDKLDLLLKITLTLSPSSLEEFQLGEKRRRTHEKSSNHQSYQNSRHMLDTIRENGTVPNNNIIEPMPYLNENRYSDADQHESMKAFVDIMLNGDEKEEANSGSDSDIDDSGAESPNAHEEHHATEDEAADAYEDELMAEAMHAILPENELDDDDFNLSFDDTDVLSDDVPAPATFTSVANRAMDKSSGPDAVLSSDSYNFSGDIEEGNAPFGVHIVSAHAELVEDDGSKSDDSVNDRRAWRKKVMCMLTVIFVTLLIICVTVPTVVLNQKKKNVQQKNAKKEADKMGGAFQKPFRPNRPIIIQEHSQDTIENLDDDEYYAFNVDTNVTSTTDMTQARSGFIENLFSKRPVKHSVVGSSSASFPDDFTLNIEGVGFKCSQVPPLL
jgi:hypothetical protein